VLVSHFFTFLFGKRFAKEALMGRVEDMAVKSNAYAIET
jgi:hypothetical protein